MRWLVPVPVVLPLVGAALSILGGRSRAAQRAIGLTVLLTLVVVAARLAACTALAADPTRT